jgi:ribonucleoside-diphosphate reductase alpha chain
MAVISDNGIRILNERYYMRNLKTGEVLEKTPEEMFHRVAREIAAAELTPELQKYWEDKFFSVMNNQLFMPNSPTLMGAGIHKCLSACSVIGRYPDSLEGIYKYIWRAANLTKHGCGVGQDLSSIRPKGEIIKSSGGLSAGVVNWMYLINTMSTTTIQGDKARRAANMVSLRFNHPDILDFINCKKNNNNFPTMNISVVITDEEFHKALNYQDIDLIWNGKKYGEINAGKLLDKIVNNAWEDGEPGLLFITKINDNNPFAVLDGDFNENNQHYIVTTNPCGEQPLEENEFCTLGSMNVENMYDESKNDVDWDLLKETIYTGERFLDNVIDVNEFVFPEFEKKMKGNRKIGLGILGFAHLLIKLGIRYDSQECLDFIDKFGGFISEHAEKYNIELAKEKGVFLNWNDSIFARKGIKRRNATTTTQAPTGTVTTISGSVAYGIEPLFGIGYIRNVVNASVLEVNDLFKEKLHYEIKNKSKEEKIIKECIEKGTTDLDCVPHKLRNIFRCANDISAEWHVKVMAQWQKYYENAVSKTINLPNSATKDDVKNSFQLAFKLGCKGITCYRDGSRKDQTMQVGNTNNQNTQVTFDTIQPISRADLGEELPGTTYQAKCACGKLYATINNDGNGNIVETFVHSSKRGTCKANLDGTNRMISSNLRSGVRVKEIIDQLY